MRIEFRKPKATGRPGPADLLARRVTERAAAMRDAARRHPHSVTSDVLGGEPAPGRSALDQRLADLPKVARWTSLEQITATRNPWAHGGANRRGGQQNEDQDS